SLWVALPQQHEVVQIELASGQFEVVRRVQTSDLTGNELSATDLHIEQDTLFVSSGRSAKVVAFALRKQSDVLPVGELTLLQLVQGSVVEAGQVVRVGQTFYVVSGDGDIQIFDVSEWLAGNFSRSPTLLDYFGFIGAATSVGFDRGAFYAGTSATNIH